LGLAVAHDAVWWGHAHGQHGGSELLGGVAHAVTPNCFANVWSSARSLQ
jgi:hypothetical protein